METLISTKSIDSVREVWWDVRPHPDFGTVELRICDGLPTLDEIGAVAARSQCRAARAASPPAPGAPRAAGAGAARDARLRGAAAPRGDRAAAAARPGPGRAVRPPPRPRLHPAGPG